VLAFSSSPEQGSCIFSAMSTRLDPLTGTRGLPGLSRRTLATIAGVIVALSTLCFLLANLVGLSDPGLQYDELLFVNAALGNSHAYHGFIYSESLGIPTMLMPYIGALKAWLYTPVFAVFGVSVDSIRVPAVLLAGVALVLAVLLIYRLLGLGVAVALAVLLATDPVYGAVSRADWGPIVLSALLRITALLCYFGFLRRHSVRYLWLLAAALLLGLFNKLDYGWFIAALGVAALVVHHRELIEITRSRRIAVLLPVAVFVAVFAAAFVTLILPVMQLPTTDAPVSLGTRITEVENLFRVTVNGTAVYQYMTGSILSHSTLMGWMFPWILIGSVLVAVWYLAQGMRRKLGDPLREAASTTTFFLILFVVIVAGIIMLLWPLPTLLATCLLAVALRIPIRTGRAAVVTVLAIALGALLVTQVRTTIAYVHAYRDRRHWTSIWTPEIYAAARAVARSAPNVESIITADWGLGTQIFALGGEAVRDRFTDEWPDFTSPTTTTAMLEQQWFQNRRVIVVYHTRSAQIMPSTTQRVDAVLNGLGSHVHPIFVGQQIKADIVED
jgi:4-amino-4-deoxy-L-arabinose transferase-like glycosyltransferase